LWSTIFTQDGGEYSLSGGVVRTELSVEFPVPSVARQSSPRGGGDLRVIWRALKIPEVGL